VHDYAYKGDFEHPGKGPGRVSGFDMDTAAGRYSFCAEFSWLNLTGDESADLDSLEDSYDSTIRHVDGLMAGLFSELSNEGVANRTIVVITSDHGEEFGEHGHTSHGNTLYTEALHVPLIIIPPSSVHLGGKVEVPASTVDIYPTILTILGMGAGMSDGSNLATLMASGDSMSRKGAEAELKGRPILGEVDYVVKEDSILLDGRKLIHTGRRIVPEPGIAVLGGFYSIEKSGNRTYRWTMNESTIDLGRFIGLNGTFEVDIGVMKGNSQAPNVSFYVGDARIGYNVIPGVGLDTYTVLIPSGMVNAGGKLRMLVPTWKPEGDNRMLGIAVDWLNVTFLEDGAAVRRRELLGMDFAKTSETNDFEYYDIATDPVERRNLYGNASDTAVRSLIIALDSLGKNVREISAPSGKANVSEEARQQLRALGYMN
jgi:hypothetical protein